MPSEDPASSARARPWAPILLLLFSVVLGVLVTEICFRIARRFVCIGASRGDMWEPVAEYGWRHLPNAEGWLFSCLGRKFEWQVRTRINALGLRDRERTYEKPVGTKRVLLLGDSITEAMQVPLENTFATLLEDNLRARGESIEVVNTGVAAYSTDNELEYFRTEGKRFAPDLVVLVFNVVNDVAENSRALQSRVYEARPDMMPKKAFFQLDAEGSLVREPLPTIPPRPTSVPWGEWLHSQLFVVRAFDRLLARAAAVPVPATGPLPAEAPAPDAAAALPAGYSVFSVAAVPPDQEWEKAWRVTEALIRALRKEVEQAGARFAVAVMPIRESVDPAAWQAMQGFIPALAAVPHDLEYPVQRITAFLDGEGIPNVSLLPIFRDAAKRTGQSGFFVWDVHLDKPGHVVVSDALTPFVDDLLKAH